MKIFSPDQIQRLDESTIKNENILSIDLMERASLAFVNWLVLNFDKTKNIKIFCGPGNNGGDGLAIARLLLDKKYNVEAFILKTEKSSENFKINYNRLLEYIEVNQIEEQKNFPIIKKSDLVVDAIFGSGLNKSVDGVFAELINFINESNTDIISVDIASGLFADRQNENNVIIKPTYTLSFQLPKLAFILPQNAAYVGEWQILDIGLDNNFIDCTETKYYYLDHDFIKPLVKKRSKYSHKGNFGKCLIIAGNYGMMGAAVLAVKGCYRSGVGIVKAYIPKSGYEIMQISIPEAMVICDPSPEKITAVPDLSIYDSIGIGPGISEGHETAEALESLLDQAKCPLVIDAGAINILAKEKRLLKKIPTHSILTPHPKEFERLTGPSENEYERLKTLANFSAEYKCYVCLKGANSAIATPEGNIYFNSTGNAGMATGGSGDVLTGIITGLLAQKYTPFEAVILGVYMHGYAGDAAAKKLSEPSMLASDIVEGITNFYKNFLL